MGCITSTEKAKPKPAKTTPAAAKTVAAAAAAARRPSCVASLHPQILLDVITWTPGMTVRALPVDAVKIARVSRSMRQLMSRLLLLSDDVQPSIYTQELARAMLPRRSRTAITRLHLEGSVTDAGFRRAAQACPLLRHLEVVLLGAEWPFPATVTDEGIKAIAACCPQLEIFRLMDASAKVTDLAINALVDGCPNLSRLFLTHSTILTDACAIRAVTTMGPRLTHFSLRCTEKLTDATVTAIAECCPNLEFLNVSFSKGRVTDKSIQLIAQRCPRLSFLDVSHTDGGVTDVGIRAIAMNCPCVSTLLAAATGKVTDEGILAVAHALCWLSVLDLNYGGGLISDKSISEIAMRCKALSKLSARFCEGTITSASTSLLRSGCVTELDEAPRRLEHGEGVGAAAPPSVCPPRIASRK